MALALRHGSRVVELAGDVKDQALIRDLQMDTWGVDVLHVDFTRVKAGEKITVEVALELRGEAPGVREGGVIEHVMHAVQVECPVTAVPEKLEVNINNLQLLESISVSQIEVPEGVTIQADAEAIVVQCNEPVAELEEDVAGETAEPEVIGRKAEDEEGGAGGE